MKYRIATMKVPTKASRPPTALAIRVKNLSLGRMIPHGRVVTKINAPMTMVRPRAMRMIAAINMTSLLLKRLNGSIGTMAMYKGLSGRLRGFDALHFQTAQTALEIQVGERSRPAPFVEQFELTAERHLANMRYLRCMSGFIQLFQLPFQLHDLVCMRTYQFFRHDSTILSSFVFLVAFFTCSVEASTGCKRMEYSAKMRIPPSRSHTWQ